MKRREFLAALGVGGAGLLTAGCGKGLQSPPGEVSFYSDNPTWKSGFEDASRQLRKASGTGLDILSVPTVTSYEQVIKAQLQTAKAPDLLKWWNGYRLQDLARIGQLTDLTDIWQAAAGKGWIDPAIRPDCSYDNKVYGLPLHESYYVVFYNKNIFAKHDLEPPSTWAEFMAAAAKLKRAGITPFVSTESYPWSFIWFEEMISKLDVSFYQKLTAGKASYTDPKAEHAMALWQEMIGKGYFTSPDTDLTAVPAMMHAGAVAMYPAGTWNNASIQQAGLKSGQDFDAFIMPTIEPNAAKSVIVEAATFAMPARAPHKQAAHRLLSHWLDPAVQKVWSAFLMDSAPNPTVISPDPVIRHIQAVVKQTNPTRVNRYWEDSPPALVEANVQDLGDFMIHPEKAKGVLSRMQSRAEAEWSYWKQEVS
ncbi:MAG: extracellular solute-binding protein [Mycobacterium sp.]|nr:extracellular solute-binding protein [Mycobacterium sp.]